MSEQTGKASASLPSRLKKSADRQAQSRDVVVGKEEKGEFTSRQRIPESSSFSETGRGNPARRFSSSRNNTTSVQKCLRSEPIYEGDSPSLPFGMNTAASSKEAAVISSPVHTAMREKNTKAFKQATSKRSRPAKPDESKRCDKVEGTELRTFDAVFPSEAAVAIPEGKMKEPVKSNQTSIPMHKVATQESLDPVGLIYRAAGISEQTSIRPHIADHSVRTLPHSFQQPNHAEALRNDTPPPWCSDLVRRLAPRSVSLRRWVLVPVIAISFVVALIATVTGDITSTKHALNTFETFHEVVVAHHFASMGRQTLSKMVHILLATGSMYFSNTTITNPVTDRLMPLEHGFMPRLCVALRDLDSAKTIFVIGAFSLTRRQAALCVAPRALSEVYGGAESKNGKVDDIYHLDPDTFAYQQPPSVFSNPIKPWTIESFTKSQHFDTVVNKWRQAYEQNEVMSPSEYWVTPMHPPTYAAFVYPFFELYPNGSQGIGYLYAAMHTQNLLSLKLYDPKESGVRVMLVDPNADTERLLVMGNSWGQPLSNVSIVWVSWMNGEPIEFLYVDTINDPVMVEAVKHVDIRAVIDQKSRSEGHFRYEGADGRVTAMYYTTEGGVQAVLVVATASSYSLGATRWHRDIAIVVEFVALAVFTAVCILLVECCLTLPLRTTKAELKRALLGAPVTARRRNLTVLREVRELSEVCDTLRRRLREVHSYMPDRLLADAAAASVALNDGVSPIGDSSRRPHSADQLRDVTCSVAYVYFVPLVSLNPTNDIVELMMNIVVGAVAEFRGCFEVQRPDFCVVSFGVQPSRKDPSADAMRAVRFSQKLRAELSACVGLAGQYRVIVESGTFLSGVISAGDQSRYVLLCRNLHEKIGNFLPHAGVVAAVTEETALLVRGRHRLLPFETIYLDAEGKTCVQLYEVIDGDEQCEEWLAFEQCYCEAYDRMLRGNYSSALRWWSKAMAVDGAQLSSEVPAMRSSQSERLRNECLTRIDRNCALPFLRQPKIIKENRDFFSCNIKGNIRANVFSQQNDITDSPGCTPVLSEAANAPTAPGSLPHYFTDHLDNVWKRAKEPVEGAVRDATPVYMGISATGTLAVLKICPLSDTLGRARRGAVKAALARLVGLEQNEWLVHYLSYCDAAPHGIVLVTEYVPGGTLRETTARYGRALPLPAVRRNVVSILRGLADLHRRGLVHGRVCPENVMIGVEGRCRLKGMLLDAAPLLVHHDSYYVSPEEAAGAARSAAGDMYALGLLLLEMLTGQPPWLWAAAAGPARSTDELDALLADCARFRRALCAGHVAPRPPPANTDAAMQGVLDACLHTLPEKRMCAADLLVSLTV